MRDDATQSQIDAANPLSNTWLSANAGSGKTRVLTDRVARLLLSGVEPQNILCLTYTKAAASEMQNRLFKRLGQWAMLDDPTLGKELGDLGVDAPDDLAVARRLFASAIETPGGLKIQTIHAFCASILRKFPLEAGVSFDFQEMDERSAALLQSDIIDEMSQDAHRPLVKEMARYHSGADFESFLRAVTNNRLLFETPVTQQDVWGWFDVDASLDESYFVAEAFTPDVKDLIRFAIPILERIPKNMNLRSLALAQVDLDHPTFDDYQKLKGAMLNANGTVPKYLLTKPAAAEMGPKADAFWGLANRLFDLTEVENRLFAAKKTFALHRFAHPFTRIYEERKAQHGWLDFDDLIHRTAALLNTSAVAQWVLYRLDGGIDHILVDEAQDTAPAQWRVIESLAREFMSGEGAHVDKDWSIFVVGDPKQSIYSFQGADPAEFTRMRDTFSENLNAIQRPLQKMPLEYSFRSAPAILTAVDATLGDKDGLGDAPPLHKAFHGDRPGRVDLWPLLEKEKDADPVPWDDPLDMPAPDNAAVVLANDIAEEIARLIEFEQILGENGFRPITAGDILVLVQRRSELFHHIIRACKSRNLPIAGADRLRIGGEMAVKDLTALLSFLATPEDDLALASVLRSPLFGWSEDDLFRLAYDRGHDYLWSRLRAGSYPETLAILHDLRDQADYFRPYDLIDRVLTRHDGRRKLVGRLGHEAEDGIDAMLSQALAYEQMEVPSLTGFLTWLDADDVEIKRQMDSESDEIRVMTVHGAKGLEAPIVILPDTAKRPARMTDEILSVDGHAVWKPKSEDMPELVSEAIDAKKIKDAEERMRLLYVAMTRAESWLIVAAAGEHAKESDGSWHQIVEAGLSALETSACQFPTGLGIRYQTGDWPQPEQQNVEGKKTKVADVPTWVETPAPKPDEDRKPLTPSDLGGAKVVMGASEGLDAEEAKRRGRQVHRLLEFLPGYPETDWDHHARALLAFGEDAATDEELTDLVAEVSAVLQNPDLQSLFDGNALAEVEVSSPAEIGDHSRIHGIIDRLVIEENRVIAIDFKSNFTIPTRAEDIPEGILRQLGAYEIALQPLYPAHEIVSAVLWTRNASLMELPTGLALRAFGRLDAAGLAT